MAWLQTCQAKMQYACIIVIRQLPTLLSLLEIKHYLRSDMYISNSLETCISFQSPPGKTRWRLPEDTVRQSLSSQPLEQHWPCHHKPTFWARIQRSRTPKPIVSCTPSAGRCWMATWERTAQLQHKQYLQLKHQRFLELKAVFVDRKLLFLLTTCEVKISS